MRRLLKAVHKRTGEEVYEGAQCDDCGYLAERVPQVHSGDEGWSVCPDCRTVEGDWSTVWATDADVVYAENDPEIEVAS